MKILHKNINKLSELVEWPYFDGIHFYLR
jgi:hypothetical protein